MNHTALYDFHRANGKLVEFAGYDMPIWYTSIVEEHMSVRNNAGIFDVSHMARFYATGPDAATLVESLFPTSIVNQPAGKSVYTLMLNEQAGIIDDLVVLKISDDKFLIVMNAANRMKDIGHIRKHIGNLKVEFNDVTNDTTMIAIQGPEALSILKPLTPLSLDGMKKFTHAFSKVSGIDATITRTGYTGEDGFEVILHQAGLKDSEKALMVWSALAKSAKPCGLGARDSLRLEAGLPLYGSDLDEMTNPIEADLAWVISKEKRSYVGEVALSKFMKSPPDRIRRGLMMDEKIPRKGFKVQNDEGVEIGTITSGTFSPLLKKGIALAYVGSTYSDYGRPVKVLVRDAPARGKITKVPFYDTTLYGWKRGVTRSKII